MNIVKFKKEKKIKICNTKNNVHNMIRLPFRDWSCEKAFDGLVQPEKVPGVAWATKVSEIEQKTSILTAPTTNIINTMRQNIVLFNPSISEIYFSS